MEIRQATEEDLPAIVDLWWEMQSSHNSYDQKFSETKSEDRCRELAMIYFSKMVNEEDHLILVAGDFGKVIGLVHMEIAMKPPVLRLERFASIREVVVAESHRRRGTFGQLLNYGWAYLRRRDIRLVEAMVDVGNPAIRAYERQGFIPRQQLMIAWV